MDKKISVKINGNRLITGILKGYDQFMNLVLDEAIEEVSVTEKNDIGQIVFININQVIRGNSVIQVEALEKI